MAKGVKGAKRARGSPRHARTNPSQTRRRSIYDFFVEGERRVDQNKYCRKSDLVNEASVEIFFVNRLLEDLGYRDSEIKTKESVETITIAHGTRRENVRPDYGIVCREKPKWTLEAKAPVENVDEHLGQSSGYAAALNLRFIGENPVRYYAVTNGLIFKLFNWDEGEPFLTLSFSDFFDDNPKFAILRQHLDAKVMRRLVAPRPTPVQETMVLRRDPEKAKRVFRICHKLIWKAEFKNPQPAFAEFAKLVFVKLWEDRKLRDDPEVKALLDKGEPIAKTKVVFSTQWIDAMSSRYPHPVDDLLFLPLVRTLNEAVDRGEKKRIFDRDEHLKMSPETVREVVEKMQGLDMYGIDEDLNGRMFEEFLSATMRGQALGQYFTPRSIVKLMERLAAPVAKRDRIERVLDGCCGTGGFLIEVLTDMRNQVRANRSLSKEESDQMQKTIANNSIFGIDVGSDPPMARIARINMYLHGDGGSRVYSPNALDKDLRIDPSLDIETKREWEELKGILAEGPSFDCVLTNPPFSMWLSENNPRDQRILARYDLATYGLEGTARRRASLLSRLMFIERYADLLRPGGRLLTVIDDATLGSKKYRFVRDFIRKRFLIRAIISLPGDAFQSAGARAKTSILYLVRRTPDDRDAQPDIFVEEAIYVGLDNVPPTTPPSKAEKAREDALKEAEGIVGEFVQFMTAGKAPFLVPADKAKERLDVKFLLRQSPLDQIWKKEGIPTEPLETLADPVWEPIHPKDNPERRYPMLRVGYDGLASPAESRLGREISYEELMVPKVSDLPVSNISAVYGSVAVMPAGLQAYATPEFTVLRVKPGRIEPVYLWAYLRSPEARARMVSEATGMGRTRVNWGILKSMPVPMLDARERARVIQLYENYVSALRSAMDSNEKATEQLNSALKLDNDWATKRLKSAKPPR